MSTPPGNYPLPGPSFEEAKRLEERYRRLGTRTPICAWPGCGETGPYVLVGYQSGISCYEHFLLRAGKRPYEAHHIAGQSNMDVTADVPGNEHRILSEDQRFWPEDTLRNPEHSPLLAAAAAISGWINVLRVIIERGVGWIPEVLEWLLQVLVDLFGREWWVDLGWDGAYGT